MEAWQHIYDSFDPVAFSIFGWSIHWYGLMYVLAFISAWWLARMQSNRHYKDWDNNQIEDLLFYGGLGVILGGRVGYVLFYSFSDFISNPLMLFQVWQGGMSFHGGLLGVIFAMAWFARRTRRSFWQVADFVEKKRATVGSLELASSSSHSAGKCSFPVAEELTLHQFRGNSAAVHRDKWHISPRALSVYQSGH